MHIVSGSLPTVCDLRTIVPIKTMVSVCVCKRLSKLHYADVEWRHGFVVGQTVEWVINGAEQTLPIWENYLNWFDGSWGSLAMITQPRGKVIRTVTAAQ